MSVNRAAIISRTLDEHIQLTPDTVGGKPRIRGRRITVQDIAIWFRSGSSFECTQQIRRKRGARLRDFVRWHQDTRRTTSHLRPGGASIREMILEHNERFARDIARDISLQETSGCCGQS